MIEFLGGESPDEIANRALRLALDIARIGRGAAPNPDDLAEAPVLDLYGETRRHAPAIVGIVAGHPTLVGRRTLLTSEIFCLDRTEGWARSWSRFYRLGRPANLGGGRR